MILSEQTHIDVAVACAELDISARVWLWSVLFCLWAIASFRSKPSYIALWPLPVGMLFTWWSYCWALNATCSYLAERKIFYSLIAKHTVNSLNIFADLREEVQQEARLAEQQENT